MTTPEILEHAKTQREEMERRVGGLKEQLKQLSAYDPNESIPVTVGEFNELLSFSIMLADKLCEAGKGYETILPMIEQLKHKPE